MVRTPRGRQTSICSPPTGARSSSPRCPDHDDPEFGYRFITDELVAAGWPVTPPGRTAVQPAAAVVGARPPTRPPPAARAAGARRPRAPRVHRVAAEPAVAHRHHRAP